MTPSEAKTFSHYSVNNAVTVEKALPCGCKAYEDVFTYKRWKAMGYQVQRGMKAIKIPTIVTKESESESGEVKSVRLFKTSSVFCRHQIEGIE
jgi:antirestriction protein ArdC